MLVTPDVALEPVGHRHNHPLLNLNVVEINIKIIEKGEWEFGLFTFNNIEKGEEAKVQGFPLRGSVHEGVKDKKAVPLGELN